MNESSESTVDGLGQASAHDGQVFHDRDGRALIRDLLADTSQDQSPSEAFGPYRDVIANLRLARDAGGIAAVRRAWQSMVGRNPALSALAAAEATASRGWPLYTLADAYRPRPPLLPH
jgi:hypothetical protein